MIDLNTFARGELRTKLNEAIIAVAENIQDANTDEEEKRGITVDIKFVPGKSRTIAGTLINVKKKLADTEPVSTNIIIGRDALTGRIQVREYDSGEIPGQVNIADYADPETGEVKE